MTDPLDRLPLPRQTVEALHDLYVAATAAIAEVYDPADKGALRDAAQSVLDVAIVHDQAGMYGIFDGEIEEIPSSFTLDDPELDPDLDFEDDLL